MSDAYLWYECHFCGRFFEKPEALNTVYLYEWEKTRLTYPYHYNWEIRQVKVCAKCHFERSPK